MQFQARTGADLAAALEALKKENGGTLQGLILDLRNNPGGLLDQAVSVANRFVGDRPDNALIVYTRGREESSRHNFMATIGEKEPLYPMVVLINGGSASASEIIAGALQDHGRAVIMGTQSFGKGWFPNIHGSAQQCRPPPYHGQVLHSQGTVHPGQGDHPRHRGGKPRAQREDQTGEPHPFREKDLDNHITDGAKKPAGPVTPEKPVNPAPASAADAVPEHPTI